MPTRLTIVDIAGLVRGASKGEGLGNQFLAHIREVDAIVHVVRCFEDPDVTHVDNRIDPVADSETIDVEYENALELMRELSAMGESNLVVERRRGLARRATLLRAAEIYRERFTQTSGRVAATFEVLFLHGWAPHESQPKPLKPGSARHRLAEALDTTELSAGEKPGRGRS